MPRTTAAIGAIAAACAATYPHIDVPAAVAAAEIAVKIGATTARPTRPADNPATAPASAIKIRGCSPIFSATFAAKSAKSAMTGSNAVPIASRASFIRAVATCCLCAAVSVSRANWPCAEAVCSINIARSVCASACFSASPSSLSSPSAARRAFTSVFWIDTP